MKDALPNAFVGQLLLQQMRQYSIGQKKGAIKTLFKAELGDTENSFKM